MKGLIDHYSPLSQLSDLRILRFLVIVVVGFAGFFRIYEMLSIKLRSVQIHDGHMQITLPHVRMTKCERVTRFSLLGRTSHIVQLGSRNSSGRNHKWTAPTRTLSSSRDSSRPRVVMPLTRVPVSHTPRRMSNSKLSYSRRPQREPDSPPPPPPPHLRSGGASQAAASGVAERIISKHGRWRSERARNAYLEDTIENRLTVSRSLGL